MNNHLQQHEAVLDKMIESLDRLNKESNFLSSNQPSTLLHGSSMVPTQVPVTPNNDHTLKQLRSKQSS
jgi:hypothetical protein